MVDKYGNLVFESAAMEVRVSEKDGERLVMCVGALPHGDDGIALVTACIENGSHRLLIDSDRLPAEFFELRTGVALPKAHRNTE